MKETAMPVLTNWRMRRATLVDVPAVARLIDPLPSRLVHPSRPLPESVVTSATRLVLAHVGLESGEFWVGTDEADRVCAAAVLLPPRQDAAGNDTPESESVTTALRLHLGGATLRDLDSVADFPAAHWLLLAVAAEGAEPILTGLLAVALPAVDTAGLPVLNMQPGRATQILLDAGFQPQTPDGPIPVLIRS
jgi:hypothetical protein